MIIPYRVDVPKIRIPWMNYLIILGCIGVFIWEKYFITLVQKEYVELMVLRGWQRWGFIGHVWRHGGYLHLIGNMLFLWVFGNAVCAKLGNLFYFFVYMLLGIFAGVTHVLVYPEIPGIGASGAIMGIVGIFVVFFPSNDISCLWLWLLAYFFPLPRLGRVIEISSIYIVIYYILQNIVGIYLKLPMVAYHAHIGGFVSGFVLAILLLKLKILKTADWERSILQVLGKKEAPKKIKDSPLDYHIQRRTEQGEKPIHSNIPSVDSRDGPDYTPGLGLNLPLRSLNELNDEDELRKPAPPPIKLSEPPPSSMDAPEPTAQTANRDEDVRNRLTEEVDLSVTFLDNPTAPDSPSQSPAIETDHFDPNEILPAPIEFQCDCGKTFKLPRHLGGRPGRCPNCRRRIFIPKR